MGELHSSATTDSRNFWAHNLININSPMENNAFFLARKGSKTPSAVYHHSKKYPWFVFDSEDMFVTWVSGATT